jgi:hypothetical protein
LQNGVNLQVIISTIIFIFIPDKCIPNDWTYAF